MKKVRLTMLATIAAIFVALALAGVAWARPTPDGTDKFQAQVIGGTPVADGEYRFMASLQYDRENTTPRQDHFCGGTLISPYHVMTAAHCAVLIGEARYEGKVNE